VILGFVGVKMLATSFIEIPIWVSLAVIALTLAVAVFFSLRVSRREVAAAAATALDAGIPEDAGS
jgi:predicted tellurium resistance membrane protein TerC